MKFQVTLKCPDALEQSFADVVACDSPEWNVVRKQCEKWFKYGELLTVEIDTEADTCTVLKQA